MRCVADSLVKMQHAAHCMHSLSERADFDQPCKRVAGVAHALLVMLRVQQHNGQRYDFVTRAPPYTLALHSRVLSAVKVLLFLASE